MNFKGFLFFSSEIILLKLVVFYFHCVKYTYRIKKEGTKMQEEEFELQRKKCRCINM